MELQHKVGFDIEDDCLTYHRRTVVPKVLKTKVLEICHDSPMAGHPGTHKTFEGLSRSFWWPICQRDCKAYVESCNTCARAKADYKKPAGLLVPLPIPPQPWFSISMDLITDLPPVEGTDSILVIVDRFTIHSIILQSRCHLSGLHMAMILH
jgi:Integrase zinc binding domain